VPLMRTVIDRLDVNLTDTAMQAEAGANDLTAAVTQVEVEVAAVNLTEALRLVAQLDTITPTSLGLPSGDWATQAVPVLNEISTPARALATDDAPLAISMANNISTLLGTALPPLLNAVTVLRELPDVGDCSYLVQRRDALLQAACSDVEPALYALMWCVAGCALAVTILVVSAVCLQIRVGRVGQPGVRLFRAPSSSEHPAIGVVRGNSLSQCMGSMMVSPPVAAGVYITPGSCPPEQLVHAAPLNEVGQGPNYPPDKSDIMLSSVGASASLSTSEAQSSGLYPHLPPASSTSALHTDPHPCARPRSRRSTEDSFEFYNAQL